MAMRLIAELLRRDDACRHTRCVLHPCRGGSLGCRCCKLRDYELPFALSRSDSRLEREYILYDLAIINNNKTLF